MAAYFPDGSSPVWVAPFFIKESPMKVVIANGSKLVHELVDGKWRVLSVSPSTAPRGVFYI